MSEIISTKNYSTLKDTLIKHASDEQKLVYTRNIFLTSLINELPNILNDDMKDLCEFIVKNLPNQNFFEKELFYIKIGLAEVYDAKKEYYLAAKLLSEINYESANIGLNKNEQIRHYLSVVGCFYEFDECGQAEKWLNKCSMIEKD